MPPLFLFAFQKTPRDISCGNYYSLPIPSPFVVPHFTIVVEVAAGISLLGR
jgi:hypothetical protein